MSIYIANDDLYRKRQFLSKITTKIDQFTIYIEFRIEIGIQIRIEIVPTIDRTAEIESKSRLKVNSNSN